MFEDKICPGYTVGWSDQNIWLSQTLFSSLDTQLSLPSAGRSPVSQNIISVFPQALRILSTAPAARVFYRFCLG